MNGPIVAQAGWTCVEFREDAYGWEIWSAGEPIGRARRDGAGVRVDTEHVALARPTVERVAVRLAEALHEDYLALLAKRPVRFSDAGFASGEVA